MEPEDDDMDPDMEEEEEDDDDDDNDNDEDSQDMDGAGKLREEEDDHVFDVAYELQTQIKEYKNISEIFRRNKVPYVERQLKRAIIYDNQMDPDVEKS